MIIKQIESNIIKVAYLVDIASTIKRMMDEYIELHLLELKRKYND